MILEYLQPEPSLLDGATVLLRGVQHVATLGAAGLALFALGFGHRLEPVEAARLRRTLLAAVAAGLVVASYAALGHSTLYGPRQEIVALLVLHLAVVAFWVGSLPPLLWVARRPDGAAATALVRDWSRFATWAVLAMLATGLLLTWYLTVRLDRILDAWHGWALVAKTLAVLAALALAGWNRLRHTPSLARGEAGAGARLAGSIRVEMVFVLLAFWAAAEMVSVHPIDYGHRISG